MAEVREQIDDRGLRAVGNADQVGMIEDPEGENVQVTVQNPADVLNRLTLAKPDLVGEQRGEVLLACEEQALALLKLGASQ